ncbi:CDP-diacylglycerol--inositol 3-phosphatidyltransferase [Malassezia cuniculi]|uniref:CDP-diacylglycerol--inositol 3-phosphatidyltransferase n=1 Tax=Malassezia cuniculi TaxID=948313 RepID=A0AAF0ESK8_9BASI|nr:CDP-diacylglycerol--inositol 3-phosphatidyltransferase [Malassezia cuniculi]
MAGKKGKKTAASTVSKRLVSSSYAIHEANEAEENVFLFVPNLIGYSRVILAAGSLYCMRDNPKVCTVLYGISCLLDAFDGFAARRLNQCSKFGAVLDMVTDRCTTTCLLVFLALEYPRWALLFQFLISLDFSSHYIHMYSSLVTGSSSHKIVGADVSRILWYYYNDSRTLFFFCACNEMFFVCLYLMAFYNTPLALPLYYIPGVAWLANQNSTISWLVYQGVPRLSWPQIVGGLTLPVCAAKQMINCVQFWKAAKTLAGIDIVERRERRK